MTLDHRSGLLAGPLSALLLAGLTGCGSADDERIGMAAEALAHPGPWVIPEETLAIGDEQFVEYTGAGAWDADNCSGGLTTGAGIVRDYLYEHFPQIYYIGGYDCRAIVGDSTSMSVHGTGRALDLMIPLDGDDADNDLGDPPGNFLIENAEAIGIQYIIWDRWGWRADRPVGDKDRAYTGENAHIDHLHIEISVEASLNTSPWFEDTVSPPEIDGCDPIPADGGIIDDDSPCTLFFGPAAYWRIEQNTGYGGELHWTNAFESDEPSNWARWTLAFEEAGSYDVEIYLDPAFAVCSAVRYDVVHGDDVTTVMVDQSAAEGWTALGSFEFVAGGSQSVDVFDDQPGPVGDDQHIAIDALRLTRQGLPPPDDPPGTGGSDPVDPPGGGGGAPADPTLSGVADTDADGSCAIAQAPGLDRSRPSGRHVGIVASLVLAALATKRRGRRARRLGALG